MNSHSSTSTLQRLANHLLPLVLLVSLIACEEKAKDPQRESLLQGTTTVWCDAEIAPLMSSEFQRFRDLHPTCTLTVRSSSARECMTELLAGKARLVMLARGYERDEDSLMKAYHVTPHRAYQVATDALVFFARKDFVVDTLSVEALHELMSRGSSMTSMIRGLTFDPEFEIPDAQSSVLSNLKKYCSDGYPLNKRVQARYHSSIDSVKDYVNSHSHSIGVGLLSQLVADSTRFKMLGIKYTDADSNRRAMTVEQSAVYRQMYPYPVKIQVLLLEDRQNFPMGVASYFAFDAKPQAYFLQQGIVPAYANIRLYQE